MPFTSGADHDFSQYGVQGRYQAGREAAARHLAKMAQQPGKLRSAA
jgi:hypothetical protein